MQKNWWLELDVSSSRPIKISVFVIQHGDLPTMVLTFEDVDTVFNQNVTAWTTGTYHVDIRNEGTEPADVSGTVTAKKETTRNQTIYPYLPQATLIILAGVTALLFGIFKKTKSTSSRKTRRTKNKS